MTGDTLVTLTVGLVPMAGMILSFVGSSRANRRADALEKTAAALEQSKVDAQVYERAKATWQALLADMEQRLATTNDRLNQATDQLYAVTDRLYTEQRGAHEMRSQIRALQDENGELGSLRAELRNLRQQLIGPPPAPPALLPPPTKEPN